MSAQTRLTIIFFTLAFGLALYPFLAGGWQAAFVPPFAVIIDPPIVASIAGVVLVFRKTRTPSWLLLGTATITLAWIVLSYAVLYVFSKMY
jgi:hypothetical protein